MSVANHPIIPVELVTCYRCGKFVILIANIRTASGKRIPHDDIADKIPHKCLLGAMA